MSCPPFRVAILWSTYDDEGAAGARAAILLTRGTLMADGWRMEQHRWVLNYALFSLLNMFMTVSRSKLQRGGGAGTGMGHKHRQHCPCSLCSSSPEYPLRTSSCWCFFFSCSFICQRTMPCSMCRNKHAGKH